MTVYMVYKSFAINESILIYNYYLGKGEISKYKCSIRIWNVHKGKLIFF